MEHWRWSHGLSAHGLRPFRLTTISAALLLVTALVASPALAAPPPPPGGGGSGTTTTPSPPGEKEESTSESEQSSDDGGEFADAYGTSGVGLVFEIINFFHPADVAEALQEADAGTAYIFGVRAGYSVIDVFFGGIFEENAKSLYFAFELLNALDVTVAELGAIRLGILTPTFGVGLMFPEDSDAIILNFPFGVTGVRVETCTPICMRADLRIPTFDLFGDPDQDFEPLLVTWGVQFEFQIRY